MSQLLHSRILGQGEPLLILHGFLGMGDNWKSLANKFAENYEVHLIDQRNHGRSFHSDEFDYELLVSFSTLTQYERLTSQLKQPQLTRTFDGRKNGNAFCC